MDDFSDDSDVNPEEMARMVEDFDDLDNNLLGGSSKKRDIFSSADGRDTAEVKKKVSFKSGFDTKFTDNDPLADPLSDLDDSRETRKSNFASTKSNLVADLFGLKNPKTAERSVEPSRSQNTTEDQKTDQPRDRPKSEDDNLSIKNDPPKKPGSSVNPGATPIFQAPRNQSRENFLQTPRVNPLKQTDDKSRKQSLMEDLLGAGTRPAAPSMEIESRPSFPKTSLENPTITSASEPRKSVQPAMSSTGYGFDLSKPREPRRGRRNSAIVSDPLGLFTTSTKQLEPPLAVADVGAMSDVRPKDNTLPQEDLPEWLGGVAKSKSARPEAEKQSGLLGGATSEARPTVIGSATSISNPQEPPTNFAATGLFSQTNQPNSISCPDMSALMGTQFDQQAAIISMQQQENELRTAASLSRQNEQVSRIVDSQRARLDEQERMFDSLIKRQIERQSMLETQMKIQQARIDHYIQTLMSQPTSMPTVPFPQNNTTGEMKEEGKIDSPECLVKQLQLENVCLENTLAILKEKHEKETAIIEASYERQISLMRESMEKLEKKMQLDSEALEVDCEKRLEKLRGEKYESEQSYREEIDRLKKNEKKLMEEIHSRQSHNVELLEREHAETIEAISRAKDLERKTVDTIMTNKTDLGDLLNRSQLVIDSFQNLQKKIEDKDEAFGETRGNYLRKQEEILQILRDQLNLQQDALADERKRLAEVSLRLDTAANELTSEFKKRSSIINETEERLASRERAVLREKQLADEQINWERKNLRLMRDAWTKEQERQTKLLVEEREAAAIERSKLEVLNRLKSGSDDTAKVELEAALKTAREAANEATQERRKWQERTRALEDQRRTLDEKEKHLTQRAKELEDLTQSALIKREEGILALKEARRLELQHKERLGQLQMQLESLADRENRIATEKLELARDRLATRFEHVEKPEKDTAHTALPLHYDRSFVSDSHVSTHFRDIVDPHLLLLKLNLDNKLEESNELISAMQVISQ